MVLTSWNSTVQFWNPRRVVRSCPSLAGYGIGREVDRLIPWGAVSLASCGVRKACEGRSGEGSIKIGFAWPEKGETQGSIQWRPRQTLGASQGTLERVKSQKPRLFEPAPAAAGKFRAANGMWVQPHGNMRLPFKWRKLRRGIPGALPVWNKTGPDAKGANRQAGNQTRKAERGGMASPVEYGPLRLAGAVGKQSSWEEPVS